MRTPVMLIGLAVILALTGLVSPNYRDRLTTAQAQSAQFSVEKTMDRPGSRTATGPALQLSAAQREALTLRKLQLRERMVAQVNNNPPSPPGLPMGNVAPTTKGTLGRVHGVESALVFGRNTLNPQANVVGNSTLNEPAVANNGAHIIASGNFAHAEYSTNGGVTWTALNPFPEPNPAGMTPCCGDSDLVIDNARRVVFHSQLYLNAALTDSVVRIFVRRAINSATASCFYDIAQPAGGAGNILMDYPHLGISTNFLYLSSNDIDSDAGTQFARMRRWRLTDLIDCAPAVRETFSWPGTTLGQRVFTPAEGTNTEYQMYWSLAENTTQIRLFRWREEDAVPNQALRTIAASTFGNPDCRGGTSNFDYISSLNGAIAGFQRYQAYGRGRLAVYWQVTNDTTHTQGHIHAAVFREDPLPGAAVWNPVLISEPHIFNNSFCFGFPRVSSNKRGDFGAVLAFGGQSGGGGAAANGGVLLDDEYSGDLDGAGGLRPQDDGFFGTFFGTTSGTENRSDGRYGDYFTIHAWEPCEKFFIATSYARNSQSVTDLESRITEFGRNRDYRCWSNWANRRPIPQP